MERTISTKTILKIQENNIESIHYLLITGIFILALFIYAQHLYIIIEFLNLIEERNKLQKVKKDTKDTCTQTQGTEKIHIYSVPDEKQLQFKTFQFKRNRNYHQIIS